MKCFSQRENKHNQFSAIFPRHEGKNLKTLAQDFQVAIHFHLGQLKPLFPFRKVVTKFLAKATVFEFSFDSNVS